MEFHPAAEPDATTLRVVVCDDHALYRRGLVIQLDGADGLEVVAEAADGVEAVEVATAQAPDVVLMDVNMPGIDGIEATRRLTAAIPTARILMRSVSDDADDLFEAVKAGAAGYVLKEMTVDDIARATRAVAAGHSFVSPALAAKLLREFSSMARRVEAPNASEPPNGVTGREIAVLESLARGSDDASIAAELGIAVAVVKNDVRNLLGKLERHTRAEAVVRGIRDRFIHPAGAPSTGCGDP